MGQRSTIVEASEGLKSSARGEYCEAIALNHYLNLNYTLLGSRLKFPFAEIDLLMQKSERLIIVEVKSSRSDPYSSYRVKPRQLKRLKDCCLWLSNHWEGPIEVHLALVEGPEQIHVIDDFLGSELAFK